MGGGGGGWGGGRGGGASTNITKHPKTPWTCRGSAMEMLREIETAAHRPAYRGGSDWPSVDKMLDIEVGRAACRLQLDLVNQSGADPQGGTPCSTRSRAAQPLIRCRQRS